jgi:hypothetical protein
MPNPLPIAFVLAFASISLPPQDPPVALAPSAERDVEARVAALLRRSQAVWDAELEALRLVFQRDPGAVLGALVDALFDATVVAGEPVESCSYTVRGNALTVLEDLTDLRLDPEPREWIGFRVHDHRDRAPELQAVKPPWDEWLRSRGDLPEARWFHGLSAVELHALQRVLRTPHTSWSEELLAPARALGVRARPRLLHFLLDQEWACPGARMVDQANRLLARLCGGEPEPLECWELLALSPSDPLRKHGTALVRNRIGLQVVQERWMVRLLGSD